MTSLLALIMHGASLAPWIRPFLAFRWSLAARALLHAYSLARRVEQATKLMDPACGEPGSDPCRTPNTPYPKDVSSSLTIWASDLEEREESTRRLRRARVRASSIGTSDHAATVHR